MAYGVVRTDNMTGTDVRSQLVSIKYIVNGDSGAVETAIENGCVLKVGALIEGEREVFAGGAVAANDELKDVVLVASPEVMYDERKRNLDEYINVAGKICRGYRLNDGDIFSVTKDVLGGNATPEVGDIVELKAGIKLNVADSATAGATTVGKIIAVDVVGRYTYYAILVGEVAAATE